MTKSKKKKFLIIISSLFVLFLIIWWFNNFTLKITHTSISSPKISDTVSVAVLSDLHASRAGISNNNIIKKINKINPDIVIVLGDMYTRKSSYKIMQIPVNLMGEIVKNGYDVYFVSGDHDVSNKYFVQLESVGVKVMNYREKNIEVNKNKLHIMGINNTNYSENFDVSDIFELDENSYNILLAHIPNYEKFSAFGADLTLCADTHGGIIQIPFIGSAYDPLTGKFLPELFTKGDVYDKGWFEYSGGAMFITSGIGAHPIAARFNNRPEIVELKIIPEGKNEN